MADGTRVVCAFPDCGRTAKGRGLCDGHCRQHREGRELTPLRTMFRNPEERFAHSTVRNPESGCLEWTTTVTHDGYGRIKVGGKEMLAHRYAWERVHGPIPDGLFACHKCDNPRCCEVEHLFLGTHSDNMQDMVEKGRAAHGPHKTHCKWGHAYVEGNLVPSALKRGQRACLTCHRVRNREMSALLSSAMKATGLTATEVRTRYGASRAVLQKLIDGHLSQE